MKHQPIPDPDPRLAPHLEPGERVLWQGWPEFAGLMPLGSLVFAGAFGSLGVAVPVLITVTSNGEVPWWFASLFGLAFFGVAALMVLTKRNDAKNGVYALTDRRALHVHGTRLRWAEGPEKVEEVKVARRGSGHGDVYWRVETRSSGSGKNTNTTRVRIGFLGVPEPEAVAARVTAWKAEIVARSAALAARFADAAGEGKLEALVQSGEAKRVRAAEAGVAFLAPADWLRVDGGKITELSLKGGLMQIVRAITSGPNTVRMTSPGGGAFQVSAGDGPPPQDFAAASQPRGGFELISADPEVRIGPWTGYAVAHKVTGVNLFGFTIFGADMLQREIWLDLGGRHLAVRMAAPTNAHDLQRALDAMAETLEPA
jgi:hypothetical protein